MPIDLAQRREFQLLCIRVTHVPASASWPLLTALALFSGCLRSSHPMPPASTSKPAHLSGLSATPSKVSPVSLESLRTPCLIHPSAPKGTLPFNQIEAKNALDAATERARRCVDVFPEGPKGGGFVQVVYEPSGRVDSVRLLTVAYEETKIGECVCAVFLDACVPPYQGEDRIHVNKKFFVE